MIVTNKAGQEIRGNVFKDFVHLLIDYFYYSHNKDFVNIVENAKTKLRINYDGNQDNCITGVFSLSYDAKRHFSDKFSLPAVGDFFLSNQWCENTDPSGARRDLDHLRKMLANKFPDYEIIKKSGEYQLVYSKPIDRSADSLIRVDYSYMDAVFLRHISSPKVVSGNCFDMAASMMATYGNISLISLMERIPVYVVDSRFMEEHFDDKKIKFDKKLFQCLKCLSAILGLLKQLLLVFNHELSGDCIYELVEQIKAKLSDIDRLMKSVDLQDLYPRLSDLVERIRRFIGEIEDWGLDKAVDNDNFKSLLEDLIGSLEDFLSTRFRMPHVEYLGVYCPEWKKYSSDGKSYCHEKAIFICWERILDCAEKGRAVDLLTKVTIHEFCHAYMDIIPVFVNGYEDVYHWMEESMANVMTLLITEKYVIRHPSRVHLLSYFKAFMHRQPDAYASAVTMWENGICDCDLWAWNKAKCLTANSVKTWFAEMTVRYGWIASDDIHNLWMDVRKEILGV